MTNRDVINEMTNEQLAHWVYNGAQFIGSQYTQSIAGLADWLDDKYEGWVDKIGYATKISQKSKEYKF